MMKWNRDRCGEMDQRYCRCGEMDQRYTVDVGKLNRDRSRKWTRDIDVGKWNRDRSRKLTRDRCWEMEQRYMWGNGTEIDVENGTEIDVGKRTRYIDVGKWNRDRCGEMEQR
jgi:hypothetical protein